MTADPAPVPGCRTRALGALRYVATASPDFVARHFAAGVDPESLSRAPVLRFDRKDRLQSRWVEAVFGCPLQAPAHWLASTQGFVDGAVAGLGWGMNPVALARPHLAAGRLVELVPGRPFDVALSWQSARLESDLLRALTRAVAAAARTALVQAGPPA